MTLTPTIDTVCERVYAQMRWLLREHQDPTKFSVVVDPVTWAAMQVEARDEEDERRGYGYWRSAFAPSVEPRIFGLRLKRDVELERQGSRTPRVVLRFEVEA